MSLVRVGVSAATGSPRSVDVIVARQGGEGSVR
jgi:hypothetical protein